MMALTGVPLFFSGFWSKDEILHAAAAWPASRGPFMLGATGALLTAFYMTRQMCYVFFGQHRGRPTQALAAAPLPGGGGEPHESPPVMTLPLVVLATFAVLLGFLGTPAWPWFQSYLGGEPARLDPAALRAALPTMLLSTLIVAAGFGLGWWLYGRRPLSSADQPDTLERLQPGLFALLRGRFFVDEFYDATVVRANALLAKASDLLDRWVWGGLVRAFSWLAAVLAWLSRLIDEYVVNTGFDAGCRRLWNGGRFFSVFQNGQVQRYLCVIGAAVAALVLWMTWGGPRQ
jgi:NADH-quinone oxidoreductase subunit L